jgi:hypothetical protein
LFGKWNKGPVMLAGETLEWFGGRGNALICL